MSSSSLSSCYHCLPHLQMSSLLLFYDGFLSDDDGDRHYLDYSATMIIDLKDAHGHARDYYVHHVHHVNDVHYSDDGSLLYGMIMIHLQ